VTFEVMWALATSGVTVSRLLVGASVTENARDRRAVGLLS
jgi:hypothetical protein